MSNSTVDVAAIPERVAAGVEWLDQRRPGWWERIRLASLYLDDDCTCILGQLEGDYEAALERLNLTDPSGLGFDVVETAWTDSLEELKRRDQEYDALTAEWKRVIEARRAQEGA